MIVNINPYIHRSAFSEVGRQDVSFRAPDSSLIEKRKLEAKEEVQMMEALGMMVNWLFPPEVHEGEPAIIEHGYYFGS